MLLHMFHCLPRFLHYVMMLHWILDWGVERALLQNLFEIKTHRSTSFVLVKLFYCLPSLFPACTGCPKQNNCFPIATLRVSMVSILYASVTPFAARHTQGALSWKRRFAKKWIAVSVYQESMNRRYYMSRIDMALSQLLKVSRVNAIRGLGSRDATRGALSYFYSTVSSSAAQTGDADNLSFTDMVCKFSDKARITKK